MLTFGGTEQLFLVNMIHPVSSLTQESEKIAWKIRKGVKDHLGHQVPPKAAKCVTRRGQPSTLPQQTNPCQDGEVQAQKLQCDMGKEERSCSCPC